MTAVDADRIRAIAALLDVRGPAKLPAPTGPGTPAADCCSHCPLCGIFHDPLQPCPRPR